MIEPSNHEKNKTFPEIGSIQIDKFGLEIFFKFNWTCPKCQKEHQKWVAGEISHVIRNSASRVHLCCDTCKYEWKARALIKLKIDVKE